MYPYYLVPKVYLLPPRSLPILPLAAAQSTPLPSREWLHTPERQYIADSAI